MSVNAVSMNLHKPGITQSINISLKMFWFWNRLPNVLLWYQGHTSYGNRAFSSVAPTLWNTLPIAIRTASSLNTFKLHLKPICFDLFSSPAPRISCLDRWRCIIAYYYYYYHQWLQSMHPTWKGSREMELPSLSGQTDNIISWFYKHNIDSTQ